MAKFLDEWGLAYFWNKVKTYIETYVDARIDGSGNTHKWFSPQMTSNNSPTPYVASSSSIYSSQYDSWMAFNADLNETFWHSILNDVSNAYLQFDFGEIRKIDGVRMYPPPTQWRKFFPKKFDFQGSNDNEQWTTILSIENQESYEPETRWYEYTFELVTSFRYYKILIHSNYSGSYVSIGNVEFLI